MIRCSVDGKPCIDDLCYGGRCMRGGEALTRCDWCGEWLCEDEICECQWEEDRDYQEELAHQWELKRDVREGLSW